MPLFPGQQPGNVAIPSTPDMSYDPAGKLEWSADAKDFAGQDQFERRRQG
jgi:hypothetical protein